MKEELKNGIIITITVVLIIIVVYFATAIFMTGEIGNKDKSEEETTTTTTSSAVSEYKNLIIASSTFKQLQQEYMVMFFSEKNSSETIKTVLKNYASSSGKTKLYIVNMDEAINKYVKSKESNKSATTSDELKIDVDTLLVIKDGTISSYITDEDEVIDKLK